ncbi:23S rRNA (uracil(747)-C(5))-methyltransferase RlmC [Glutamicibacter sp. ZJUTW]|uniref:23S rRNA (uracil(747)-C(5))-methyltransferase RlmC n=1 Tax=Glutamicibacter sp. ZJUTW TaxID=1155384 RepID=UPI0011F26C60|nr:23S rRNA (uracil(747)-C(5))-methyltransferase RlmC [Glutamicibacter sp. ZJUTW]QEP06013.1 23S rRNA (uracil(747)-C(5))-methyltransferase RlmC [Glutamicibacter sp. ZJUTW]
MDCLYFSASRCRSCTLMTVPYARQLQSKVEDCQQLLSGFQSLEFLPPQASNEQGFRNKAKMVISGTTEQPTIGILDADGHGVDLRNCGVIAAPLRAVFPVIEQFIHDLKLIPYDVPKRKGELKHVILTLSDTGSVMVRWVLRTKKHFVALRDSLPQFLEQLPRHSVVSVNFLPEHKAVLEGEEEIILTRRSTLEFGLNGVPMHLRPQGFFQTNSEIAAALYRQARQWINDANPESVWDLYSGVGGFALHCAAEDRTVYGIETSADAVEAAKTSAKAMELEDVHFKAQDATEFALNAGWAPDAVIVNPPRRGISAQLAAWLNESDVQHVIYSSCNAKSLARDLERLDNYTPQLARVMDMFPQTSHYEVIVKLERKVA